MKVTSSSSSPLSPATLQSLGLLTPEMMEKNLKADPPRYVLDGLRMTAWWQRGFAIGVAAHGLGTSRALSLNAEAGAFSGLAMGMHGVAGALLIPLVANWIV